jgi:hypothetical protein
VGWIRTGLCWGAGRVYGGGAGVLVQFVAALARPSQRPGTRDPNLDGTGMRARPAGTSVRRQLPKRAQHPHCP